MAEFKIFKQLDASDCGVSCLLMIFDYLGINVSPSELRKACRPSSFGVSIYSLRQTMQEKGVKCHTIKTDYSHLIEQRHPCILFWDKNHFVVLKRASKTRNGFLYTIADPASGLEIKYSEKDFCSHWVTDISNQFGIALILDIENVRIKNRKNLKNIYSVVLEVFRFSRYLKHYKYILAQVLLGLLICTIIQLCIPLITQYIVDYGIKYKIINFIYLILLGQFSLLMGYTIIEFLRNRALLFISANVNIDLINDYIKKLLRLPISFFESRNVGDIIQRISDHSRIQNFFATTSLTTLFNLFSLIVYGVAILFYSPTVFYIYIISCGAYFLWILVFLNKRKRIDQQLFQNNAQNQNSLLQIIYGVNDTKLNLCGNRQRNLWLNVQLLNFELKNKQLSISQYQQFGAFIINQIRDLLITIMVALYVIQGKMSLGCMLAIQYIIGQLNNPVNQLVGLIRDFQDAHLSAIRLLEVYNMKEESSLFGLNEIGEDTTIRIHNLYFSYPNSRINAIDGISITINKGEITAIVGSSGSGKSTLMKLLLGYYNTSYGSIRIGENDINDIKIDSWRSRIGVVLQDGYIYSDTLVNNIVLNDEDFEENRFNKAIDVANIRDFIEQLPLQRETKIGDNGFGISSGQKQRILIARAVYRNPDILFFDEATNSLDAKNESILMTNLSSYLNGKTAVIIAHRLSTIVNADKIIVLDHGTVIEEGTHYDLLKRKGAYYNLVTKQLNL